jgi:hypothetical protein
VPPIHEDLARQIKTLEKELQAALEGKEQEFRYRWANGKAVFEKEVLSEQRKFKAGLLSYLAHSRISTVLTAPVVYLGIVPFALLDLFLAVYQMVCFPAYGMLTVKRGDFHPGDLLLGATSESIALPPDTMAFVEGKSSLGRLGLLVATATTIAPGFHGVVVLELANTGTVPLELVPGRAIAQLVLQVMTSPVPEDRLYRGKYYCQIKP